MVVSPVDSHHDRPTTLTIDEDQELCAAERLQEIADEHIPKSLQAGVVVENGSVYREIVQAAKDLQVDQVVMGAHRPSVTDFLLGPNSARVARHAECTVTVVRH